jgi:hypothetical protein
MIAAFNRLFDQTKPAFAQERTFERARTGDEFLGWLRQANRKRHAVCQRSAVQRLVGCLPAL